MSKNIHGVYKIECNVTQKRYVGSSGDIYKRWYQHRLALKQGVHHSIHLQRAWNRHGEGKFTFAILERCDLAKRFEREQFWIDQLNPEYNSSVKADVVQYLIEANRARAVKITHCPRGHTYDETNTAMNQGKRICRQCNADRATVNFRKLTAEEREQLRQQRREYYVRTKEERRVTTRQYTAEHKEEKRAYDLNYRAQGRARANKAERRLAETPEHREARLAKRRTGPRTTWTPSEETKAKIRVTLMAKFTHCKHGHPFDEQNTLIEKSTGKRICRACRKAMKQRIRERAKG